MNCKIFFVLGILLSGCAASSATNRPYRDPVTYSFEAYTPHQKEEGPMNQFLTHMKESARTIQDWEKKHLW